MGGAGRELPGHTSNIFFWLKPNRFPLVCLAKAMSTTGNWKVRQGGKVQSNEQTWDEEGVGARPEAGPRPKAQRVREEENPGKSWTLSVGKTSAVHLRQYVWSGRLLS